MDDDRRTTAMRRQRNPRGEGHRLRGDLVEAACDLLEGDTSDAELSLRAVARKAGVAATTVYLHFADRDELLWAVSETLFTELAQAMDAVAATTPADDLRARALAYCQYGLDHPGHYRVLFGVVPMPKAPRPLTALPGGPVFEQFEAAVRDNLRTDADQVAVRMTTMLLWAALHGLVGLRASKPQFPWPPLTDLVDAAVAVIVGTA